jgi:hypothetical protein
MSDTKQFHISDVLTITTGRLVSTRHMDGVYDILNWMTGESLYTHQLPRASRECAPALLAQFPALVDVPVPDDLTDAKKRDAWLVKQGKRFGYLFDVAPLPPREAQYDTPIADAIEMMGDPTKVLVVEP